MPDIGTVRAIQGELALGRLSVHEIASNYGVPEHTVYQVRAGLRSPTRNPDAEIIPRTLQAYADALTEPLGVLEHPPEPAEPGEEDLQLDGAAKRYDDVRAAKRRAIRRARSTAQYAPSSDECLGSSRPER